MSELYAIPVETPAPAPPRRGWPILAWLVVLGVVALILWRYGTASSLVEQRYDLVNMRLQGRYLVGAAELEKRYLNSQKNNSEMLYKQAQGSLDRGTYPQRLRFVVLAGELKGPNEAREQLQELDRKYRQHRGEPSEEDAETAQILGLLYDARAADPGKVDILPEEKQQKLKQQLDWFGELALTPPGSDVAARAAVLEPAYRTVWTLLAAVLFMLGLGTAGLILLITLAVLFFLSRLRGGLRLVSPHHGIYAETFAVYMLLYLGLGFAARHALDWLSLDNGRLAFSGLAALGSLAALAWPMLRGIPWHQVRRDIGWHMDRKPGLEPIFGIGCYVMALPMLAMGLILFLLLTKLRDRLGWGPDEFGPSNAPGHPIVFWVGHAGWWVWLEVLFVASIVAPIVEETMFRGVLYRHLRGASSGWRPALSVLFSAMLASFLFAAIHPQGILAAPALMGLALSFSLMREWRGTLLPPMIAHGINNGVATLLLFLMN